MQFKIEGTIVERRKNLLSLFLCLISLTLSGCSKITGAVNSPVNNQVVGTTIECEGSISGTLNGQYIWLAISELGENNEVLYWPKEEIVDIDKQGRWTAKVFEDGPGTVVDISMLLVEKEIHQKFKSWFDQGAKSGSYPGISDIKAEELFRVEDIRVE